MANLFADNFNRPDEELDASADWTERNTSDWDVVSNVCVLTTDADNVSIAHILSSYITTADYKVTADLDRVTQTSDFGICGRRVNSGPVDSDCYNFIVRDGVVRLFLYTVAGGWVVLDSLPATTVDNTWYTCILQMNGTSITSDFDNGAVTLSATDPNLTASGDAGFNAGQGGVTSGARFDNFSVDDLVTAGGRIMGSLASNGGLAGIGGLAGQSGGLAG